jgi:hypothetical protein
MTEDLIIQIAPGRAWNKDYDKEMPALYALTEKGDVLFYYFKYKEWVELGKERNECYT